MSLRKSNIRQRIGIGFGLIVLIATLFGLEALWSLSRISADTTRITLQNLPGIARASALAEQIQAIGDRNNVLFMKDLLAPDDDLRSDFCDQIHTNLALMEVLANKYESNVRSVDEKKLFAQLKTGQKSYEKIFEEGLALCNSNKLQNAMQLKEAKLEPALSDVVEHVRDMERHSQTQAEATGAAIQATVDRASMSVWIGVIIMLMASIVVALAIIISTSRLISRVVEAIAEAVTSIGHSGGQVSASSQTVADNATRQAQLLGDVFNCFKDIGSVVKANSEHSKLTFEIAQRTSASTESGMVTMGELHEAVQAIKSASGDISAIVKTIDGIAFQTNILALNAAVEAARAGEMGLGFAVVADEVRQLAQRSAVAAKETALRIEKAIERTDHGAVLSEQVLGTFGNIQSQSKEVAEHSKIVLEASTRTVDNIAKVHSNMGSLDVVTQTNTAGSEESAAVAAELLGLTHDLEKSVAELQVFLGSTSNSSTQRGAEASEKPGRSPAQAGVGASLHGKQKAKGNGFAKPAGHTTKPAAGRGRPSPANRRLPTNTF
jgi:methyl-accepting chemotaxis protein